MLLQEERRAGQWALVREPLQEGLSTHFIDFIFYTVYFMLFILCCLFYAVYFILIILYCLS